VRILEDSFSGDPALDTAVNHALLLRVARGELLETLRLARPGPMVAFGKRDTLAAGYPAAVAAARGGGFEAIERLAGGRAAVFHEGTIAFSHAVADRSPRAGVAERFDAVAGIVSRALERLGVDARVGEVRGEYCPGSHSVSARGRRKLMGVGQRLVAGGAHVGAVIVVEGAERVRDILVPVYSELGLEWEPGTTGGVSDEVPGVTRTDVVDALRDELEAGRELEPATLDEETLALARELAPDHLSPPLNAGAPFA
jgi:octanoyl-[GcvH]:protein N-octanoyltransferase